MGDESYILARMCIYDVLCEWEVFEDTEVLPYCYGKESD